MTYASSAIPRASIRIDPIYTSFFTTADGTHVDVDWSRSRSNELTILKFRADDVDAVAVSADDASADWMERAQWAIAQAHVDAEWDGCTL